MRTEADVLQSFADELENVIPEPWSHVEMVIDYDPHGMINFQNTYDDESGARKHIPFSAEFLELVPELAEAVRTQNSGPFRRAIFTLDEGGNFATRYFYEGDEFVERRA